MTGVSHRLRSSQGGFTLIELMVSLVIGFAVVGALLAAYFASFSSSRHSEALSQMAEDATLALNIIRTQVAQAGYVTANVTAGANPKISRPANFTPITGCDGANLSDLTVANGLGACAATVANAPDSIEIAYEATPVAGSANGVLIGGVPVNCTGNKITADGGGKYWNDSKFYVASGRLYCHGPTNSAADVAPLVDNVTDLQIRYGVSGGQWGQFSPAPGAANSNQVQYYRDAPAKSAGGWDGEWLTMTAVNICVKVRSAEKIVDTASLSTLGKYIDCDNSSKASTDGFLYRTFSTTVVLQNMLI